MRGSKLPYCRWVGNYVQELIVVIHLQGVRQYGHTAFCSLIHLLMHGLHNVCLQIVIDTFGGSSRQIEYVSPSDGVCSLIYKEISSSGITIFFLISSSNGIYLLRGWLSD